MADITPKLAYLSGFLRDGSVTSGKSHEYKIVFYQKSREFLESVINPMFKKVFGVEPKIKFGNGCWESYVYSKEILKFFVRTLEFPLHRGQTRWDVPDVIKKSNFEIKKFFITGFFDAEGSVSLGKKPKLAFYQSWFTGDECPPLKFIKDFLNENGIKTSNVNGPYKISKNFAYELTICSKEGILNFS